MRSNWFEPNGMYAFLFGMSCFDACYRKNKKTNSYEQAFSNLSTVKTDCNMLLECLNKYGFKKRNVFNHSNDPTTKEVDYSLKTISKMVRTGKNKKPMEKYLLIFLFAGHGLMHDGQ